MPFRIASIAAASAALALPVLEGCASLPQSVEKAESRSEVDVSGTRLGRAAALRLREQGDARLCGFVTLPEGASGFAVRMLLARAAERTLDVQTYIWRGDATGILLFDAVRNAAQRGIRVRLLLDDLGTRGLDGLLLALAAERNLEVRLFNPFADREHRNLGFVTDFSRLNRRMHNKAFIVDGSVAVVGGRNVGDEYFQAKLAGNFLDNEIAFIGPAVGETARAFDLYWNSESAWPAAAILKDVAPLPAEAFADRVASAVASEHAGAYAEAMRALPIVERMLAGDLPFEWAEATIVYDDPRKGLGSHGANVEMLPRLLEEMGRAESEIDLVSAYFVPDDKARSMLAQASARGVRVRVLTNSLAATDVSVVHAGYARHRVELLQAGIRLYELKGVPDSVVSSLHAKIISVDRRRAYVGSFNLDPRSEHLNTEMGIIVSSPALASRMSRTLDERLGAAAYELRIADDGRLQWITAGQPAHDEEPDTTAWMRLKDQLLQLVPFVEWML